MRYLGADSEKVNPKTRGNRGMEQGNMILSEGLVLQEEKYWRTFLGRDVIPQNNACELYFEEERVDAFYEKLKTLYPETEFVNLPMTHSWGQRVVRFYDLDGNLIEVGAPV